MAQMPLFNLIFIGLGWPLAGGEFVGSIIIFYMFSNPQECVKSQNSLYTYFIVFPIRHNLVNSKLSSVNRKLHRKLPTYSRLELRGITEPKDGWLHITTSGKVKASFNISGARISGATTAFFLHAICIYVCSQYIRARFSD